MIPWFQFTVVHIGPIPIQVWGFFVALGMLVSMMIIAKRSKQYDLNKEVMMDLGLWMLVCGVVFARLFHIFFYELGFYISNPVEMLKIWHGGLSSFGGLFGALIVIPFYLKKKKIRKSEILKIADLLSFSALFGWIIGRVGCFIIHDHIGRKSGFFLAIGSPDGSRLEMALLEIIALIPLAYFFFLMDKKKKSYGFITSMLFMYYGIVRFFLDFFRATDITAADVRYLGLTPGQYFAIVLLIFGGYLYTRRVRIVV
ncbi:MAG: prolipoprotein diacylglyceryl transferase [Candidatus Magasanikbacteria bacterium]